ncbi:unnamed protein product [Rhizophagus irregularis]|uniref:BED-type domain-containing protein n=2 Tax=Rhizophagus irregularis TaxID=588596 RepID=A0A915YX45_9GLOM|nr:unnamed protein product [Rhizophagus irregularis]
MSQKNNNKEFEFNHRSKRTRYINITDEEEEPEQILDNEEIELENHQEGGSQLENKDDTSSALSTLDEKDEKGSIVWKHFDRFVDNKGTSWAKCRYCGNGKYNMDSGSTGNLLRHLNKLHPNKVNPSIAQQAEIIKNFLQSANNVKIKFSNELFRAKLVEWIATDDQPFTVVESPEFRYVIQICNAEAQIPTADTIKSDILKLYKSYHINIQNILQNTPGKISFALDAWTSPNVIGFLGITGHYIDADWNIKDILVDFVNLSGSHSGENMANMFVTCLKEKKILTKILAIAADNAANNNTFLKSLEQTCVENHIAFHHKENHVRCIAHIMNLTVQEILKHIRAGEAQDENIILEELLEKNNKTNDIIPKLRKLIVKIRASPQRRDRFSRQCDLYPTVKDLNLILDVKTRWNSTYLMIERALQLQKPLDETIRIEPELEGFSISSNEWQTLKELCRVFAVMVFY